MDAAIIKLRFDRVWGSIARIDAQPQLRIAHENPNARQIAEASLAAYATRREILVDSAALDPRPIKIRPESPATVFDLHPKGWEFVVLRENDPGYWAISEEEHEWLVFTANEEEA